MDIIHAIILGIMQGLTEFLPVSSSGHLVILQTLFGFNEPELLFDCAVHMGTLLAVLVYFFKDIKRIISSLILFDTNSPDFLLAINIVIASIPTAIIGFTFMDLFEKAFSSALTAGIMLCMTGIFLAITRLIPERHNKKVGILTSLIIGTAQGIAIIPGISRSGATITCALACGLERELAFNFSFLLSIPAITGAFLLESLKIEHVNNIIPLLLGTISSAIVGILALKILTGMVKKGQLHYFSPYCILRGIVTIIACL